MENFPKSTMRYGGGGGGIQKVSVKNVTLSLSVYRSCYGSVNKVY